MTKIEKLLYTAKAHSTGGREGGASRTDDGRLAHLSLPAGSVTREVAPGPHRGQKVCTTRGLFQL